jgi:uncharacterized membrane protein YfcA
MFDLVILSWRYQIILVLLLIYICSIKLFINLGLISSKETKDIYYSVLNIKLLFNWENLLLGCCDYFISVCFFLSINFTYLGICVLILNSKTVIDEIGTNREHSFTKQLGKIIASVLLVLALILFLDYFIYNSTSYFTWQGYVLALLLCFIAVAINSKLRQRIINIKVRLYTPFDMIIIQYINSTLISVIVAIVYIRLSEIDYFTIFTWLNYTELIFIVGIGFGLFGLIHIVNTIYSSINLDIHVIKITKLVEIPLNDLYAIALSLYEIPYLNLTYTLAMIIGIFAIFISEYWKVIINKYK